MLTLEQFRKTVPVTRWRDRATQTFYYTIEAWCPGRNFTGKQQAYDGAYVAYVKSCRRKPKTSA